MKKPRLTLCPTCKQDMRTSPHESSKGYCSQCGQGLAWRKNKPKKKPKDVPEWVKKAVIPHYK